MAGEPGTAGSAVSSRQPAPTTRAPKLRNVQALRGVAALVVVAAHFSGTDGFESRVFGSVWTSWSNLPANTGVDLFFVISGLIMVVTTWGSFDAPGSAGRFLWRRITRIYPLYWVVNTAVLALFLLRPDSVSFDESGNPDVVASYLLLPTEGRLPVLVAWSLVYEMYFYLLFTLALLFRRRFLGWVIGLWATATVMLSLGVAALHDGGPGDLDPYLALVASPLNLEFVLGVCVGYAVLRGWIYLPRVVLWIGIVLAVALLTLLGATGWEQFPSAWFRVAGPGVVAAMLVYGAVGVEIRCAMAFPVPLQRLGDWSYSLYLIHVPVLTLLAIVIVRVWSPGVAAHVVALVAVPACVVLCAFLCHRLLEHPMYVYFRGRRPWRILGRTSPEV